MIYLKLAIVFFIGYIVSSIGLLNMVIILRVGLPKCAKLINNEDQGPDNKIALKSLRGTYICSLFFWAIIIVGITALIYHFLSDTITAYWIGFAIAFVLGFNATGNTPENYSDFFSNLRQHYKN